MAFNYAENNVEVPQTRRRYKDVFASSWRCSLHETTASNEMHAYLLLLPPILYLLTHLYRALASPLRTTPGPFWARFTNLWYFDRVRKAHFQHDNIHLHQKYGPVVRVGPGHYSISDPAAVKTVYGTGTKFTKAAWYEGWKHPSPDNWTLFPDRNVRRHGMYSCAWIDEISVLC